MNEYLIPLFQDILKMSAYAAVATLLVIAIRFFLRKKLPAWFSYALWGIVLLRLILPVGILSSSISLFNLEKPLRDLPGVVQGATTTNTIVDTTSVTPVEAKEKETAVYDGEPVGVQVEHEIPIMAVAACGWITGIVIFVLFAAVSHILTLRRLRFAVSLNQSDLIAECAKNIGLKRRVRLVSSDLYDSPVVCGLFRPQIVLPVSLTDASPHTLRAILTHELIHIKRFDLLWNLIGTLTLVVHWFNPMVWISAVLSRRDRERSCDERTLSILGDNKQYAETLLAISALQSGKNAPIGALAFGEEGVKNRIKSALSYRKKGRIIIALSVVVLVILSVTLVTAAADRKISISQAEAIVMKDLRVTNLNINTGATIELEEFGNDEIYKATGFQIFKVTGEFHQNEAFFIKDGLVEHTVPGFGGYGINDLHLSDFNGDGQKELLYTYTYGSGMMQSNIGFYDPWERSSSSHGIWYTGTMTLEPVSDNEFTLLDTAGKPIGSVIGSWDGERNSINVTTVYGSDDPQLYVSAWPNPYSPFMSSSPGMRLDVSYSSLSTGVRYRAETGSFVSLEDDIVTDLGNDTIQITGHEVYWRPPLESSGDDIVTVTILYHPDQPDNVLTETMLLVTYDGVGWYSIGEGAGPASSESSSSGVIGGSDPPSEISVTAVRTDVSVEADINGDGYTESIEIVFKKAGPYINRTEDSKNPGEQDEYTFIRATIDGIMYEEPLGVSYVHQTFVQPFRLNGSKQAVAVVFDVGGTGMGNEHLFVVAFENGLKLLPVPIKENRDLYGFNADVTFLDNYKVRVQCPETGFSGEIMLNQDMYQELKYDEANAMGIYDANGSIVPDANTFSDIDGICDVKTVEVSGRECVEISQYIWGVSHADGLGLLVTDLIWDNGAYLVADQRCEALY